MNLRDKIRIQTIICQIAIKERTTPWKVRSAMQEALDAAWNAAWTPGNLSAQVAWQKLFPGGNRPTLEEFLIKTSALLGTKIKNAE